MHLLFFSFQEKKTYFVSFSHCCGALVVAFNFKVKALICLCAYSKVSNDNRSAYNSLAAFNHIFDGQCVPGFFQIFNFFQTINSRAQRECSQTPQINFYYMALPPHLNKCCFLPSNDNLHKVHGLNGRGKELWGPTQMLVSICPKGWEELVGGCYVSFSLTESTCVFEQCAILKLAPIGDQKRKVLWLFGQER